MGWEHLPIVGSKRSKDTPRGPKSLLSRRLSKLQATTFFGCKAGRLGLCAYMAPGGGAKRGSRRAPGAPRLGEERGDKKQARTKGLTQPG